MTDGQFSWIGGIDSGRPPTIASAVYPEGLKRNQLAWLANGTVRGGGISQRAPWKRLAVVSTTNALYQGGWLYEPDYANPYLMLSIGGRIIQVRVDTDNAVNDLSTVFGLTNPPVVSLGFFTQGEIFLIIQAGDFVTLPLFWDGTTLRRSIGITNPAVAPQTPGINEIPAAGPMDYYMGRLWYANGRVYSAGDIVRGGSGAAPYQYRDAILNVTENPLAAGGDGFIVPSQAGNIRGIRHTAELDTALGQGRLYIGTRKSVYRLNVPVSRTDWIAATNLNQPLQTVAQIRYGFVGDRCLVNVNGDLFYQSINGEIRSLTLATRYFQQWGNTPISRNENRVLRFNDRALLQWSSGVEFDNRLLQTALPLQTGVGIAHRAILPLDYDLISALGEKEPPAWEGAYEGLDILQLFEGDFGGLQRCFALVVSRVTGAIEVWELDPQARFETGDKRVQWFYETPAYTWGNQTALKELEGGELYVDKLFGTVEFLVEYRVDQNPCWIFWHKWKECVARDCTEDISSLFCPEYPTQPYCEAYKSPMTFPKPPAICEPINGRPSTQGYQFQVRVTIKGWCRVRGLLLHALPREKAPFENLVKC